MAFRNRLLLSALLLPLLTFQQAGAHMVSRSRIARCIMAELGIHPVSHLVDLYKYFFQDYFGPGHLVSSREGAAAYLDRELQEAVGFEPADYQELGYTGQFVRVNLRMVAERKISRDDLLDAFMESANRFRVPEIGRWRREWAAVEKVIRDIRPDLPGLEAESLQIDSLLQSGDYAVHHSRDYSTAYEPHYRIIHLDPFNKLMEKTTIGAPARDKPGRLPE